MNIFVRIVLNHYKVIKKNKKRKFSVNRCFLNSPGQKQARNQRTEPLLNLPWPGVASLFKTQSIII